MSIKQIIKKKAKIRQQRRAARKKESDRAFALMVKKKIKKDIRVSIVSQIVKPTFNRSAWNSGANSKSVAADDKSKVVSPTGAVLKKVGFNKTAWKPDVKENSGENEASKVD